MEVVKKSGKNPIVTVLLLGAALCLGSLLQTNSSDRTNTEGQPLDAFAPSLFPQLLGQVANDLSAGNYQFLPNRRSIWVVNRSNGRLANYLFMNNEAGTIQKSRIGEIDMTIFPREDTAIVLSDRNLSSTLWVCNTQSGDVQMWELLHDGEIRAAGPIVTSDNLRRR